MAPSKKPSRSSGFWSGPPNDHLRHASFVALREDKDPLAVVKDDEAVADRKAPQAESLDRKRQRA